MRAASRSSRPPATRSPDVPLSKVGTKGLFTKEIEEALLDGRADLAVHSLKDLPTELPAGLVLAAIPEREDARDAMVGCAAGGAAGRARKWAPVRCGARRNCDACGRIWSSNRCAATWTPGCASSTKANIDAIVLAAAGLKRLGWQDRIAETCSARR